MLPDGYASQRVHYCRPLCVYMTTPTGRGGGSLFWQRVPLSRLALPVNRDVQYNAVIVHSAVISNIMHRTPRLTGHAWRDNGTHCQDMHCRHRDEWAWPCTIFVYLRKSRKSSGSKVAGTFTSGSVKITETFSTFRNSLTRKFL